MASYIQHRNDRFSGVIVDISKQTLDVSEFTEKLKEAMQEWTSQGKRGLWLNVPTSKAALIPQITELGFDFHHAQPGYVCLTKWLPQDIPSNIPGYANHFLGVAGFVVNSHNQLLVIREKYHVAHNIHLWKLPGGLADAGEELNDTARREVLEETGVDTEFVCVIGYRHMHNYRHGCSDIYTVCLMKPLTSEIKPCPVEIAECRWMDLNEYENHSTTTALNRYFVQKYREIMASGFAIGKNEVLSFDKSCMLNVYSVQRLEQVEPQ